MTTKLKDTNLSDFKIGPVQKNNYGGNFFPIIQTDGKHPRVQLSDTPVRIPFTPSAFQGQENSRMNLDLSLKDEDTISWFRELDRMVLDWAIKNSEALFPRRRMSVQQIQDAYCPLLQQKSDFDPLLRTKINNTALVFRMDEAGPPRKGTVADITAGSTCIPVISFDKIWTMSTNRFGLTAVTSALCLWQRRDKEINEVFPFLNVFDNPVINVVA